MNDVQTVIACRKLGKTFFDGGLRVPVFDHIDMTVKQGELIAIVGASGAGKSTLLQILGGLDKPTTGVVEVMGHNIHQLSESRRSYLRNHYLGFVYQFHHLLPEFNALENVAMPLLIRGEKAKIARQKAYAFIEKVGLIARIKHRIGELSGGERQRIAIARALVTEPNCVLADEPTGNLDEDTGQHVVETLLQLNQALKTSFIIVTHNRKLAQQMDKTLTIHNGALKS